MSRYSRSVTLLGMVLLLMGNCPGEESSEELTERLTAERFVLVLEKNPRRGTAFEKVYGYHVERGSLDEFLKKYRESTETASGPEGAAAALIVGLFEAQRGNDAAAIRALTRAEALDGSSAMASYLLGQTLVLSGRSDEAAAAFERSIQRKPAAADLLEVFQSLGRVYQRSQKNAQALEVWNRLERQFPNDPRVQEQIATTLLEENDLDGALPRFEALSRSTRDKYRQSLFRVEAAEIKVRLGKTAEALTDFETLLKQLNPENWLFRDIRRRVETVFLRGNDQAGLITYYQAWIEKNPEDLDAVSRLARMLFGVGRSRDAQVWLIKGLKQAPSNKELRTSLITLLQSDHKYQEAAEQYRELDKSDPNNPDTLRDWGRALLKDPTKEEPERKQAAAAIWRRLLSSRPNDAHAALQVAELFRHAGMTADAVQMYRRGMELAPESVQYYEYLGEYLQTLKRTDEALAVWREMATGSRKTATNVARLAEVLSRNGQLAEAIDVNGEACRLDPKDLNLQLKQSDLLSKADRHEASLQQLADIEKLVVTDEEREAWLQRQLAELKSLDRLKPRINQLRQQLAENRDTDKLNLAENWYWIARAEEASGQPLTALQDIARATALNPKSVTILTTAARLNESQRNLRVAVEMNTKLAAINRRTRTEYLKRIMILEEKLGHREQSLQAGRDLLTAAPGNPELSDLFAQLCFRVGRYDEGIQTLRRSLRANPGDLSTLMKLAAALGTGNQAAEAIELLWRAYTRARTLDERLPVVQQLAEAHSRAGLLNQLYIRLERERRDPALNREITLCLARAYETAGDLATAQRKLETLLTDETRDTDLLTHLRVLAERQNKLDAAIRFQRQLWQITNHKSDRFHLAQLLLQSGQHNDAIDLLTAEANSGELTADVLRLLDVLQNRSSNTELSARLESLRKRFPDNWELLYREAIVVGKTSPSAAMDRFEAILKLDCLEDELSLLGRPLQRNPAYSSTLAMPLVERLAQIPVILQMTRPRPPTAQRVPVAGKPAAPAPVWVPRDYGTARMAAWCWLLSLQRESGRIPMAEYRSQRFPELSNPATRQQHIDLIIFHSVLENNVESFAAVRELMLLSEDDIEPRVLYVKSALERVSMPASNVPINRTKPSIPLPEKELLDEILSMYREIAARPDLVPYNVTLLPGLLIALNAAGQQTVAAQLQIDAAKNITTPIEYAYLMSFQQRSPDLAIVIHLLDRMLEIQDRPVNGPQYFNIDQLPRQLLNQYQNSSSQDEMLAVWRRYIRLLAHNLANRSNRTVARMPRTIPPGASMTPPGVVNAQNGIASATPGFIYSPEALTILLLIHRQFDFSKRSHELTALFEAELDTASKKTTEERLLWQHAVAYLLWINNKHDASLEILKKAADESPTRKDLRLGLVHQYELGKRPSNALALLDSITADSPFEQREMSKMALRLAIAVGHTERAKLEILRICENIPTDEIESTVRQLLELGLPDKAEALLATIIKPDQGLRPDQMRLTMDIQLAQGKNDEAAATATKLLESLEALLQRPVQQMQVVNGRIVPADVNAGGLISHCYNVLRSTGKLGEMIETAEKQLEMTPSNERLINQLISFHNAVGNQARIDELITHKLKLAADKPPGRYALILRYLATERSDSALEQLKILCEKDPAYLGSRCRESLFQLQGKKQLPELVKLLGQLDWGADDKRLSILPTLVDQLCTRPDTAEAAEGLFVKLWEARPERQIDLLERFPADRWWQLKQVRARFNSIVVPQTSAEVSDQWKIFGRVMRREAAETGLVTVWNRILSHDSRQMTLDPLAADIEQGLKTWPDWTAGAVMLATIDLRRNKLEAGRDALDRLFPELEQRLQNHPMMAWEIGQELICHPQCMDVGVKYLTIAIHKGDRSDWMSTASPGRLLMDAYVSHGRQADARKLLMENIPATIRRGADPKVIPSSADLTQMLSIGRALRALNYPMDAIEIYLAVLQRPAQSPVGGYDPRVEVQSSLVIAFGELTAESLVQHLEEFDATSRQFSMPIFVRQTDPARGRMQGRWDTMWTNIAQDAKLLARTQAALDRIREAELQKLASLVVSAQLQLAAADRDKSASAVAALVRFVEENPLQKGSDLPKEAHQQRQAESDQIVLWLVARQCLIQPTLAMHGEQLARRAIEVSRPPENQQFMRAILTEWLQIATEAEDSSAISRLKAELDSLPAK